MKFGDFNAHLKTVYREKYMGFAEDFNARMLENCARDERPPGMTSPLAREMARADEIIDLIASGVLTAKDAAKLMGAPPVVAAEQDPKTGVMRCPGCMVKVGIGEIHLCDRMATPKVMRLPAAPAPRRPLRETSCDFKAWTTYDPGATSEGARAWRLDGKITTVRLARGALVHSAHCDFARWLAIAKLEAEDETPLRRIPGPDYEDPTPAMMDYREQPNLGIKTLNLPPARTPFVSSVGDWDLLPWS